ncbi:MAG TPA: hypothetical protein VK921_04485 [Anditalea sp.]|nr:hypothetical protein [Anditalea sp.]
MEKSAEQIRNNIIEKLYCIDNKELLFAMDKLLDASINQDKPYKVTSEQKEALEASDQDIIYGRLISDEDLNAEEDEWLKE